MEGPAVNTVMTRPGRGTRLLLLAGALVLAACCVLTARAGAAGADGCGTPGGGGSSSEPCVIMIQVDGLEATDVTQEKTPFLWELAHPGDPSTSQALSGRNGWIWQAPRASMSAGLASNVSSFITGGYAEQTGVPADDFRLGIPDPAGITGDNGDRYRLGGSSIEPDIGVADDTTIAAEDTLFTLVHKHLPDAKVAAFTGDPNLGPLVVGALDNKAVDIGWYPAPPNNPDPGNPQNPALCDLPRGTPAGAPSEIPACAASDEETLAQAFQDLNTPDNTAVVLTYIELAELGRMKRSGASTDDVATTLGRTDTFLRTFFEGYASDACSTCSAKWGNTIVMLTGTSGYEATPLNQRVPNPDNANQDLADFVENFNAPATPGDDDFELIPQGTVATVYSPSALSNGTIGHPTDNYRAALTELKAGIEGVNADCDPDCVEEVRYLRSNLTPDQTAAGTVEGTCDADGSPAPPTCGHPDWHLDHLKIEFNSGSGVTTTTPTGRSGELLVVTENGWATGKAVPDPTELTEPDEVITNPYPGSTGGPRNRSVAAIINGFATNTNSVASLRDQGGTATGWYPVANAAEEDPDDPECASKLAHADADPSHPELTTANATPGDDANAAGHECQAETLDFAPTVAALLKIPLPSDQICGRILDEAFNSPPVPEQDNSSAPEAAFISGPVTAPAGQQYPQTDRTVTFEYNTNPGGTFRDVVDCGEVTPVRTTFECQFDSGAYEPCGDAISDATPVSKTIGPLAKGIHEFCVRAVSDKLRTEPDCAKFEVVLFFDFDGVVRDLRATVTDYEGKSWALAPNGRRMDRIAISADYGKPLNAVTLTLYKQSSGKVLCGQTVFRPKAAAASASAQTAGVRSTASCPLTGLARFKPFKLDRGHVDLRLRIPSAYKPTHVGVTVQEVTANVLDPAASAACQQSQSFFCFYSKVGAAEGGIVQIIDARRLHSVKGQKPCKKTRKAAKAAKGCKKKKK